MTSDRRLAPRTYGHVKKLVRKVDSYLRLSDTYVFEDRSRGDANLVCMMAGDKPELWPLVMPRLKAATGSYDVCITSAGRRDDQLSDLCRENDWSYLSTSTNDACLAQNVCYRLHEGGCEFIVKLNEDIFVLENSVADLIAGYRRVQSDGHCDLSVIAPTIPIDPACYRDLLSKLGLLEVFESRFGKAQVVASDFGGLHGAAAAVWFWEKTAPIEQMAERLKALHGDARSYPSRVTGGMIGFERKYWQEIGHLPVYRRRLMVGRATPDADGEYFSVQAVVRSRPIVRLDDLMVGRFAFFDLHDQMADLLRRNPELFSSPGALSSAL